MGNSPRPGLWALEKSTDYGKSFKPWMYFSDSTHIKDISIGGRCMCNGHADTCDPADPNADSNILYDAGVDEKHQSLDIYGRYEGGGVCQNCQHNTEGINCNKCQPTFYRPSGKRWDEIDVCQQESGRCECRKEFNPPNCDSCAYGYFDYPNCKPCTCNLNGTEGQHCTPTDGICPCKYNYAGQSCEICEDGYYSAQCKNCNCDTSGTEPSICDDVTGQCICKLLHGGTRAGACVRALRVRPRRLDRRQLLGRRQVQLPHQLWRQAVQPPNFDSVKCDRCREQFYNYPACEECNCDPRGVVASFAGCGSVPAGELCQCKDRVQGRICNDCKPLFWNMQEYNPYGCEECRCHLAGTLGGLGACDTRSGQCECKSHVGARTCDQCRDGFYRLQGDNVFGCTRDCDKQSGQCRCHSRVEGRRCDRPIRAHYVPTLHQYQFELEDGVTQSGPVRYRNNEDTFPGYSWKGYVLFSMLQNEVINVVQIPKSSLYRLVLKYMNPLPDNVRATVIITPESVVDIQQK
ncbi:putative laminin A chain [Operophtera brumata]|uniref:Putative laminin A chain n=1 Tax=Operophtera brumata TaxID=104452 RepID=A0A0L7L5C3_OPEBR|nr:putative laminin A chain [Operophtera brumata]